MSESETVSVPVTSVSWNGEGTVATGYFQYDGRVGTSATMIEKTYGHLLPDALDRTRSALDAFIVQSLPKPQESAAWSDGEG